MTELRDVFPAILVLTGAPEKEILEKAAWAHGRSERHKVSTDHAGRQSQSSELAEVFHGSDLLPQDIDHGRLLRGSRPADAASPAVREAGLLVDLPDISQLQFTASCRTWPTNAQPKSPVGTAESVSHSVVRCGDSLEDCVEDAI